MIDIIFLSYDEPIADYNYQRLVDRFPYAKRVHGVEGIKNAHIAAAKAATSFSFYVVDGDNEVSNDFGFDFKPAAWDKPYVHIFQSLNPVTKDIYGYGGIKIFHKSMFKNLDDKMPTDFTTSVGEGIKCIDVIASTTHFNSTPFHAWRGAYREVSKLAHQDDQASIDRLNNWIDFHSYNHEEAFGDYVYQGARMAMQDARIKMAMSRINDYEWLELRYKDIDLDFV